jgi:hypothetical protein
MRHLIMTAAAAAVLLAAPAFGADRVCKGEAEGANDATVEVVFTVDGSGAITKRSADWTPPGAGSGLTAFSGAPSFTITYGQPTEAGIGAPTQVVGSALSMKGPALWKDAVLAMILDGDGGHEWSAELIIAEGKSDHPKKGELQIAFALGTLADAQGETGSINPDLLPAIEKAKTARLGFRAGDHVVGSVTDADLSDHAARRSVRQGLGRRCNGVGDACKMQGGMNMRAPIAIFAAAIAATTPAAAATRICQAEANGAHNETVQVSVQVSDDGSVTQQAASWSPPSSGASPYPLLVIDYALAGGKLGAVNAVGVAAMVDAQRPPKSPYAAIMVQLDGSDVYSAEWGMYHQNFGQFGSTKGLPPGAKSAGFFGFIPFAFPAKGDHPARNPGILTALTLAHAATVTIGGHSAGPNPKFEEKIADNRFNLDDKAARDTLVAKALIDVLAAAKHPQACKAGN